jgi:hypothetical protein
VRERRQGSGFEPSNQLVIGHTFSFQFPVSSFQFPGARSQEPANIILIHASSAWHHDSTLVTSVSSGQEVVMKRVVLLLLPLLTTGACAYPALSSSGPYGPPYPMQPRPYGPQVNVRYSPVGRWDNVMMTAVGTRLFVLMMNGSMASGDIVSASDVNLRLQVASGAVDLSAADVMRVDKVTTNRDAVQDGARGAAFGAGVVAVLGLIVGHVPPPNLFAAGAIIGAEQNVEASLAARGAQTIYLARGIVPPGTGPQQGTPQTPSPRMGQLGPCGNGGSACNPQVRYTKVVRR